MLLVGSIGIRDMQRAVKLALRISSVNYIDAFWRPMISLPGLGANGLPSERDLVSLDHLPSVHQFHRPNSLVHDDAVGGRLGVKV